MLGWSVQIWHHGQSVLHASTRDVGLDRGIRDNAEEGEGGSGYPNNYRIRNAKLPNARLYEWSTGGYREFTLGPLPDVPQDALLSVELWDQS